MIISLGTQHYSTSKVLVTFATLARLCSTPKMEQFVDSNTFSVLSSNSTVCQPGINSNIETYLSS